MEKNALNFSWDFFGSWAKKGTKRGMMCTRWWWMGTTPPVSVPVPVVVMLLLFLVTFDVRRALSSQARRQRSAMRCDTTRESEHP